MEGTTCTPLEEVPITHVTNGVHMPSWLGAPVRALFERHLPAGWLDAIPGRILAAVEIASELAPAEDAGTAKTMERVSKRFTQDRLIGGWVVERVASVWSHFRLGEDGATRFLVQGHRLTPGRYGRLLQRLVEIGLFAYAQASRPVRAHQSAQP